MYRQKKTPTDPCNAKFVKSYGSKMRGRIYGWRDKGYSFGKISRLLLPLGFDISDYYIKNATNSYDTRILEEAGAIKESMIFLKERGISKEEIKRRLHEEGIDVDKTSIGYAINKWEPDEPLSNKPKPVTKRGKTSKPKFYRGDNAIDFPGNNTNGSIPARPVRHWRGY